MKGEWRIAELTEYGKAERNRILDELDRAGITTRDGREWLLYGNSTEHCQLTARSFSREKFFVYRSKGLYQRLKAWQEKWRKQGEPEAFALKQIGEETYTENSLKNALWALAQSALQQQEAQPDEKQPHKAQQATMACRECTDDTLRPYQAEAKRKIISAWGQHRNVMFQMPTGTGKTRLFVSLIADIRKHNPLGRILIVTHREELVQQISESLTAHYGLKHGILQGKNTRDLEQPIVVAAVQSIGNEKSSFSNIIVDEAHHCLAPSYRALWERYPAARKLGVTATPYRLKRATFRELFDCLITSAPMRDFIDQGYLADYRYYTVSSRRSSLQRINRLSKFGADGDYQKKDLDEIYNNEPEIDFLHHCYRQYAAGSKGIVYAVNRRHAEQIAACFKAHGVDAASVDSTTRHAERVRLIGDFREGRLQVLVNVELFTEGFDCPSIEFVMLARPTRSLALYLQQVGRALRPSNQVIILDCVGLHARFGLPDREREWDVHFEGGKPARPYNRPLGSDESIAVWDMQEVGLKGYRSVVAMESGWWLATDAHGRSYIVDAGRQKLSHYSFRHLTREADGNYRATFCRGAKEYPVGTFRFTPRLQLIAADTQELAGCRVYRIQPDSGCYTLDRSIDTTFYRKVTAWSDYWLSLSDNRYTNRDIYPQVRTLMPPEQLLIAERAESLLIDGQTLYLKDGSAYHLVPDGFQLYYRQSEAEGARLYGPLLRQIWQGERMEVHRGYALLYNRGEDKPHTFSYFDYLFDNKF